MYVQQTWQCIYNPTHWGPQKIFGGPHAARGPQFGHPWYKVLGFMFDNYANSRNNLMVIQTQKTDTLIDIKSCLHFLECEEKLPCFFEAPTCTT